MIALCHKSNNDTVHIFRRGGTFGVDGNPLKLNVSGGSRGVYLGVSQEERKLVVVKTLKVTCMRAARLTDRSRESLALAARFAALRAQGGRAPGSKVLRPLRSKRFSSAGPDQCRPRQQ